MNKTFELLAPAGVWDAFIAAVNNGANAVYMGGKMFNARSSAGNFDLNEIEAAIKYARRNQVKVYITVNTLVSDEEVPQVLSYVGDLYSSGVDAVILQDIGLADRIREIFPNLALHASTQMTVHNSEAAKYLEKMGFRRIIAERQMTLQELIQMREAINIELEVFAHGALCVSYSGQCLMSSLIGGRSGNRGRCAQPCRLEYDLCAGTKATLQHDLGKHLLSTKDLNLIHMFPALIENGFSGIKIEGRMKRPEYVATVIRIYRNAIDRYYNDPDGYSVDPEDERQLEQIFNRDFTQGFLFGDRGKDLMSLKRPNNRGVYIGRVTSADYEKGIVTIKLEKDLSVNDGIEIWVSVGGRVGCVIENMSVEGTIKSRASAGELAAFPLEGRVQVGDRVFRTHDQKLIAEAQSTYLNPLESIKVPLKALISLRLNKPLTIELQDPKGNVVRQTSERTAELASNYSVTIEQIAKQVERMGNTDFFIENFQWDVEPNLFMPLSVINDLRRKAVLELEEIYQAEIKPGDLQRSMERLKTISMQGLNTKNQAIIPKLPRLAVTVNELESAMAAYAVGADIVYWGGDFLKDEPSITPEKLREFREERKRKSVELSYAIPRITKDDELQRIQAHLSSNEGDCFDSVRLGNFGHFSLSVKKRIKKICIDYPLQAFNSHSIEHFGKSGAKRITLSPELTMDQIKNMVNSSGIETECLIHGQIPVMVTEYCPISTICTEETANSQPCSIKSCRNNQYMLKDKLGYEFPIITNEQCRIFIMNSKELCLFDNLQEIMTLGLDVIRIEAGNRGSSYTEQVVSIYRHWLDRYDNSEPLDQAETAHAKRVLQNLSMGGITKGHYFRGVE